MLIICNDLSTKNPVVKEAIVKQDEKAVLNIAQEAKSLGFNCLELNASDLGDKEAEALLFLANSVKSTGLKLIFRTGDNSIFEEVLPKLDRTGIIAPRFLSVEDAEKVFALLKKLDENWGVLFTQTFGDDSISAEVEGLKVLISKAEQEGIMPERQFMEPIAEPLIKNNRSFAKLKRTVDAFSNSYPSMNFYIDLPLAAEGLDDETTLMNVFIGMTDMIGVNAFCFGIDHKAHLKALKAAEALLDNSLSLEEFIQE